MSVNPISTAVTAAGTTVTKTIQPFYHGAETLVKTVKYAPGSKMASYGISSVAIGKNAKGVKEMIVYGTNGKPLMGGSFKPDSKVVRSIQEQLKEYISEAKIADKFAKKMPNLEMPKVTKTVTNVAKDSKGILTKAKDLIKTGANKLVAFAQTTKGKYALIGLGALGIGCLIGNAIGNSDK